MTFDNGTWWLAVLLLGALMALAEFLLKRSLFCRIDEMSAKIQNIDSNMVKKTDYEKAHDKALKDIEQIKKDYTPRNVHDGAIGEIRIDIKKLAENYLTKQDFYREQAKNDRRQEGTDRKIDKILDLLMNTGGRCNE